MRGTCPEKEEEKKLCQEFPQKQRLWIERLNFQGLGVKKFHPLLLHKFFWYR